MRSRSFGRTVPGALVALCIPAYLAAQEVPIRSWEVPRSELSKTVDPPAPFASISPPCRLNDSRVSSGGPGPIPSGGTRDYDFIPGGSPACGALPGNVVALSLYFTVVGPLGPGFLFAYPAGSPPGSPTSIINYNGVPGELRNNAAIVPVNPATGSFTVGVGGFGTDVIIDINGVFYRDLVATHSFSIVADSPGDAAIAGRNTSTFSGSHGVKGFAAGGLVHGVQGEAGEGSLFGSSGVHGVSSGFGDHTYGVLGEVTFAFAGANTAAVRGDNHGTGTEGKGVWGYHAGSGTGVFGATGGAGRGVHGYAYGHPGIGVWGTGTGTAGVGVFFEGGLAGTGTKSFVEPHPTDPALAIRYVSLEGPEAGVYFRGKGRFLRGLARIAVPESFRIVTAEEGLSIQVTPIGGMATVGVLRIELDEIVVQGSRDLEFFYTVNGLRRGYKDWNPITSSEMAFRPRTPDDRLPENLSEDERNRLIRNGTYNPDGSINLETARRLGWDENWRKEPPAR